jgi:hypothetical protein
VHGLDRGERLELAEYALRNEVTAVKDQVGAFQLSQARGRQATLPAWQVGVRDDGDSLQMPSTKRPFL